MVNQVERAKVIAQAIQKKWPEINIICYHSEFTRTHRIEKERLILAVFKDKEDRLQGERNLLAEWDLIDNNQVILITTQICELSLDISADIMYSEIAPVDSIIQRAGRLHRNGKRPQLNLCGCAGHCLKRDYLPEDHEFNLWIFPIEWERKSALYPYYFKDGGEDLLLRSWEIIGEVLKKGSCVEWINKYYN